MKSPADEKVSFLKLHVSFRKRASDYRALLRRMIHMMKKYHSWCGGTSHLTWCIFIWYNVFTHVQLMKRILSYIKRILNSIKRILHHRKHILNYIKHILNSINCILNYIKTYSPLHKTHSQLHKTHSQLHTTHSQLHTTYSQQHKTHFRLIWSIHTFSTT